MKNIYVCQIVDNLSESVTHTFLAAGHAHAVSQFCSFLKSLPAKSVDPYDFTLYVCGSVEICESFKDCNDFASSHKDSIYPADEVFKIQEVKDEGKS